MMPAASSVVVLGVGNRWMGDDGVGVRALEALSRRWALPPAVRLCDGNMAAARLMAELAQATHLVVVDALLGGGPPGTIYRLAPEELPERTRAAVSTHGINLAQLLSLLAAVGRRPATRIVGVQPAAVDGMGDALTPPLAAALPGVVSAIVDELRSLGVSVEELGPRRHAGSSLRDHTPSD
jgi:hydrogenase maturation protease